MSLEAMWIRQKIAIRKKKGKFHRRNYERECHLNFFRSRKKMCTMHFSKPLSFVVIIYAVNSG